jgi:hypothetical protein
MFSSRDHTPHALTQIISTAVALAPNATNMLSKL